MLFDERPKDNMKDLFGRDEEVAKFERAIQMKRALIIISGLRRAGKTSLLKTMISQNIKYGIFIDLRNLTSKKTASRKDIMHLIQNGLQEFLNDNKSTSEQFAKTLKRVRGVNITTPVAGFDIQLEPKPKKVLDLVGFFTKMDQWAKDKKETIFLAIDEAQEFRKAQHFNMEGLLASMFDNCKNIVIVLTGSEAGLLYEFLGKENPKVPLYGRSYVEIKIKHLSKEKSKEFILKGFKQYKIERQKIILGADAITLAAVDLGGVLGWLIKFGLKCVERGEITTRILDEIKIEGAKLAKQEYDNFMSTRVAIKRYEIIMKVLATQPSTWNSIKTRLTLETKKRIHNGNLSDLLNTLQKVGFIKKTDNKYQIEDPLLRQSFQK